MKRKNILSISIILFFLTILSSCGFTNPMTPAGFEGYLIKKPYIFGKKEFFGTQIGQTSAGLSWRIFVINIDMRPTTKDEEFEVLSKDQLTLHFKSHLKISLKSNSIKDIVEKYGAEGWYERNLKQIFRSEVYTEVSKFNAFDSVEKRDEIGKVIFEKLKALCKNTPFIIETVVVGNIMPPKSVALAVEEKLRADQELMRKDKMIEIAKKDATIRIEEAKGIAEAQKIINTTLTQNYLQHEAIKTQEKLAGSPNTTFIYIPTGSNGIPIVNAINQPNNSKSEK
ncbi:MAG: hypothetical protein HQK79_22030 [Desulfobacterales bacterium]|nr:hypothetical protein [Desulfobacterales bacterium]MBF0398805.1 hypothetical protein [Desulfobacterales bacterium]